MRRALLGALLLAGCGPEHPPPDCVTGALGLRIYGNVDCPSYALHTQRTVDVFAERLGWDLRRRVQNWYVRVQPRDENGNLYGNRLGEAHCDLSTIVLVEGAAREVPLAHELAHAYQDCRDTPPCAETDRPMHCGWTAQGIYAAIREAQETTP